ncbi:T9SS type A sorting domain-containing protein [Limibacter armeniacum]|uniref:T9SS type A sorting domain-containing protein n=1 Tax=Limibacter armeniacum TaxID=466084 RepID=UPI002FE5A69B
MRYSILSMPVMILALLLTHVVKSQVTYTANDKVPAQTADFIYGSNMGYYPPWTDAQLADIAAGNPEKGVSGIGYNGLRPALPEHFLEQYGYQIRASTFQHYHDIGANGMTAFIGYPSDAHMDPNAYCDGIQSKMFDNMYEPIWDNGANGTAVNENNYMALYLYKMLQVYGPYVKYWEVWNEPDFSYSANSRKTSGQDGNWWDNDPNPCDLKNLQAPIQHYIRALRISYEVIKTYYPDSYVCVGGIGYVSFLDAVLRNTDNPNNGAVSKSYPLKGGAYFDCLSFHSYPHYKQRKWNNSKGGFDHFRHSDAALDIVRDEKATFESVLNKYGYGKGFPEKAWIVTETNIPRFTPAGAELGGTPEEQRNFVMKTMIAFQNMGISANYIYNLADKETPKESTDIFKQMGSFKPIEGNNPYDAEMTTQGLGLKTLLTFLDGYKLDAAATSFIMDNDNIDGGVFTNGEGDYKCVIWAKTKTDQSETSSANVTFPSYLNVSEYTVQEWDHAITADEKTFEGNTITLQGSPLMIELKSSSSPSPPPTLTLESPENLSGKVFLEPLELQLSWNTVAQATEYVIEKAESNASFVEMGTANSNSFMDSDVELGKEYKYRVMALNEDTKSSPSNVITVKVTNTKEAPILVNFSASSKNSTRANTPWNNFDKNWLQELYDVTDSLGNTTNIDVKLSQGDLLQHWQLNSYQEDSRFPANVLNTYRYIEGEAVMHIADLDTSNYYDIQLLSATTFDYPENVVYEINGATKSIGQYQNKDVVTFEGIKPDQYGNIFFKVSSEDNRAYLNALIIYPYFESTNQPNTDKEISKFFQVYPNPFNEQFIVLSKEEIIGFELISLDGKRIKTTYEAVDYGLQVIPLVALESGVYILKVSSINKTDYIKILKQ